MAFNPSASISGSEGEAPGDAGSWGLEVEPVTQTLLCHASCRKRNLFDAGLAAEVVSFQGLHRRLCVAMELLISFEPPEAADTKPRVFTHFVLSVLCGRKYVTIGGSITFSFVGGLTEPVKDRDVRSKRVGKFNRRAHSTPARGGDVNTFFLPKAATKSPRGGLRT